MRASFLVLAVVASAFIFCSAEEAIEEANEEPFVVHEWGVMLRQPFEISGRFNQEREVPGLGPSTSFLEDLPDFVVRHDKHFLPLNHYRAWRKPVIHCYGQPKQNSLTLSISLPQNHSKMGHSLAKPLAYWPIPDLSEGITWFMGNGKQVVNKMTWTGTLSKDIPASIPAVLENSWWNELRKVPSAYISTKNGSERFLFYEATAKQEPTVHVSIADEDITLKNTHSATAKKVLIIINDQDQHFCYVIRDFESQAAINMNKNAVKAKPVSAKDILQACKQQWIDYGMTSAEAQAIVEIWKEDLTQRAGLLVVSCLPRDRYDAIFPIAITPEPSELVRVGMIFDELPNEAARLSWLPQTKQLIAEKFKMIQDQDGTVRAAAAQWLLELGDILAPVLEQNSNYQRMYKQLLPVSESKAGTPSVKHTSKKQKKNKKIQQELIEEMIKKDPLEQRDANDDKDPVSDF